MSRFLHRKASRLKTKTLKKKVNQGFVLTLLLTSALYLTFIGYTMQIYYEKQESFNASVVENYASLMEKDISALESFVKSIVNSNPYFERLTYSKRGEFDYVKQINGLTSVFQNKIGSIDYPSVFFFNDPDRTNGLVLSFSDDYTNEPVLRQETYRMLRAYLADCENGVRFVILNDADNCLIYVYTVHGNSIGFILDLTMYEESYVKFNIQNQQLLLLDGDQNILAMTSSTVITDNIRQEAFDLEQTVWNGYGTLMLRADIGSYPLEAVLVERTNDFLRLADYPIYSVFILGTPLVLALVFIGLYQYLKRIMLMPLEYLHKKAASIRAYEEVSDAPQLSANTTEFAEMNADFDEIFNEIIHLQEEKHLKERDADLAQLQYYQLQLNPHFFLNCLNIIYTLLKNGDDVTEKKFTTALISHFRYVFNDKLSLVLLRDELKEVKDYVELYTIRKGIPVLLKIQADEDCLNERIPILAVQTFVENSIKYASDGHNILSVTIRAFHMRDEEREYLCIQIHDNGRGYDEESLKKNNTFNVEEFRYNSEHVGIPNLKYRMHLIYKDTAHLAFHNHQDGGAAVEILCPIQGGEYDEYNDHR